MGDFRINLNNPAVIAGWPGMGSVALGVVEYLRRKLGAVKFDEVRLDPLTTMDSVVVNDGVAKLPPNPKNAFYYCKNPDLIIFQGEAQVSGYEGVKLLNKVLDIVSPYNVSRIYTGAAFPLPTSHKDPSQVYGAVNKKTLLAPLSKFGVSQMEGGHISGLNGLLLGFAEKRGMEAVCLLATMPQYAISLPNPKASAAIIEVLSRILRFNIDMKDLDAQAAEMDERMAVVEDRVKDAIFIDKEEPPAFKSEAPSDKQIPQYIMDRIEKLFNEAINDKTKAIQLKKELDRWDLYARFEDRFLDLFKKIK